MKLTLGLSELALVDTTLDGLVELDIERTLGCDRDLVVRDHILLDGLTARIGNQVSIDGSEKGGGKRRAPGMADRRGATRTKHTKTYLLPLRSFSCTQKGQSAINNQKESSSTSRWWVAVPNGRTCHGRARDPDHNTLGAGGDLLTFTIASLIMSIWIESADIRDTGDTPFTPMRWGGGSGSEETYHGRRREERAPPSWPRW